MQLVSVHREDAAGGTRVRKTQDEDEREGQVAVGNLPKVVVAWAEVCSWFFFSSRRRHTRCSRDWSSDVCSSDLFRDLGLLVVDEEQRFGVAHKERIKQMRKKVDVLTLTATPIPRTLNMSLVGIRDMSVIETPPKDRLSIQTNVVKFDAPVIERAIRNEMARGGQVYFVHNRVESIFSIANLLQRLVPEARIA